MKEIDAFEANILGVKELLIGTREYDCNKSLSDLDFKEELIIKEIKRIERN